MKLFSNKQSHTTAASNEVDNHAPLRAQDTTAKKDSKKWYILIH